MGKLEGKIALITGGGSGIGRATAVLFAAEGARVAVVDCVPEGGKQTVDMISKAGSAATFIEADVSRTADVKRMIGTTVKTYGRLDILHNNAGVKGPSGPVEQIPVAEWDRAIAVDLRSVFLGSKYAIPVMLKQGGGIIINTASVAGMIGLENVPAYCAAKAGVIQLTKVLATRYWQHNIRINCICPGYVDTPILGVAASGHPASQTSRLGSLPGGRLIEAQEIARTALYLACDDSSSVIGAALVVDRGWVAAGR